MIPIKLSAEEYINLLKNSSLALSSTKITMEKDYRAFVTQLSLGIKLEVVIFENSTASFYAKSIQGHHIALYTKLGEGNIISVDLKCTDALLGTSLINEINQLFRK